MVIDVTNLAEGNYQLAPTVKFLVSDIVVESILPGQVEVELSRTPLETPIPTSVP